MVIPKPETDRLASALESVLKTTPEEDGALNNLAWIYAISGDPIHAVELERNAISIAPNDSLYRILLATFLEKSGQEGAAEAAYCESLIQFPRLVSSPFWHALETRHPLVSQHALQEALLRLQKDPRKPSTITQSIIYARLLLGAGKLNDADQTVRSTLVELPNQSGLWEMQGELHEAEGNSQEALADYRRAMYLDRSDPLPVERKAMLELRSGSSKLAENDALAAWKIFQQPFSEHSIRIAVQYRSNLHQPDLLPASLPQEVQPIMDFESLFRDLGVVLSQRGFEKESEEMIDLADEIQNQRDLF